jgi:hypothetical protein
VVPQDIEASNECLVVQKHKKRRKKRDEKEREVDNKECVCMKPKECGATKKSKIGIPMIGYGGK